MGKSELPPIQIIQQQIKEGTTFEVVDHSHSHNKDVEGLCRIIKAP